MINNIQMSKLNDDAMINLKLIAKIEENKKLSTKNNIIEPQMLGILPECVTRYIQGEDKNKALKIIKNTIYDAIELSDNILTGSNLDNFNFFKHVSLSPSNNFINNITDILIIIKIKNISTEKIITV